MRYLWQPTGELERDMHWREMRLHLQLRLSKDGDGLSILDRNRGQQRYRRRFVQSEQLHEQLLDRVSVSMLPVKRPMRVQLVRDRLLQLTGVGSARFPRARASQRLGFRFDSLSLAADRQSDCRGVVRVPCCVRTPELCCPYHGQEADAHG